MGYPQEWMVYKGTIHLEMDENWGYPFVRKPLMTENGKPTANKKCWWPGEGAFMALCYPQEWRFTILQWWYKADWIVIAWGVGDASPPTLLTSSVSSSTALPWVECMVITISKYSIIICYLTFIPSTLWMMMLLFSRKGRFQTYSALDGGQWWGAWLYGHLKQRLCYIHMVHYDIIWTSMNHDLMVVNSVAKEQQNGSNHVSSQSNTEISMKSPCYPTLARTAGPIHNPNEEHFIRLRMHMSAHASIISWNQNCWLLFFIALLLLAKNSI